MLVLGPAELPTSEPELALASPAHAAQCTLGEIRGQRGALDDAPPLARSGG
jgi:hypothetical protein